MRSLIALGLAAVGLVLAGCAAKTESAAHDHPMACAKCKCNAMEADPADATKCKACSHLATEHTEHRH